MTPITADLLYIDAPTGLAGDMLMAGLLSCGGDQARLEADLSRLDLGPWELRVSPVSQQGLAATQVDVIYPHQHTHRHLSDISEMIRAAAFPKRAEDLALRAFRLLAEAEAKAHGCDLEAVHFHEVGAVDSILDVCGVCLLLDQFGVERVFCSTLPLSHGWVDCAHGRLPVPAPAVANLLTGLRMQESGLEGELITPTGAALLRAMGASQEPAPAFTILAGGRGAGHRELPLPNAVRLLLGRTEADPQRDVVEVIHSNIDDSSGELLAALWEKVFAAGGLDLAFSPIFMKKGRPAWQVELIVPDGRADEFAALLFAETGAIGCRISRERRVKAARSVFSVETPFGPVAVKAAGNNLAPEADSVAAAARQANVPFKQVYAAALAAALAARGE